VPVELMSPVIFRSEDRIERLLLLILPLVGRVGGVAGSAGLENMKQSLVGVWGQASWGRRRVRKCKRFEPIRTEGVCAVKPCWGFDVGKAPLRCGIG
jgi:hypothetical protein